MSSAADFVAELRDRGIRLSLDGERLNCTAPPGVLTPELRTQIGTRKDEIKAFLRGGISSGIPRIPREARMPVSNSQQRLWFLKQMDPQNTAYNVPSALRLKGQLDAEALERTLQTLLARHEALRTRFTAVRGEPAAIIDANVPWRMRTTDLTHLPLAEREGEAFRRATVRVREPFDAARGPFLRAELLRIEPTDHLLVTVVDHIVADGMSAMILIRELIEQYSAFVEKREARLPELDIQFADYAVWHRQWLAGGVLDEHLPYWKKQLSGSLPVLQLPTDRPRPPVQTFNGTRKIVTFPRALSDALKAATRREGVTLFMMLLAAFKVLLQRYTGEEDVIVGSVTVNRERPETTNLVGFFASNIVLRTDLSGNPTVRELLGRVREVALQAYAHGDAPFDSLVEALKPPRELNHPPLFQVLFILQSLPTPRIELPGLEAHSVDLDLGTARFDITLDVFDAADGLKIYFEYNTDLFDASTIDGMLGHYRLLLEGFAADSAARIADLPMLGPDERATVLAANPQATPYPSDLCIHELFAREVQQRPNAESLRFENTSLTYAQLNQRANQLARQLRSLGARPGALVGVCLDRSADLVIALLAVLKSGAAYVPLDPAFPQDRLRFMAEDAGLQLIVTQASLAKSLSGTAPHLLSIDTEIAAISSQDGSELERLAQPSDLAYVIYTSGSTGRPKGVQLEHRGVVNFLKSMHREPGFQPGDRLLSVTTVSFDIAALEIFGPLTSGGTVIMASRAVALDARELAKLLVSSGATIMQATPATWRMLIESGWRGHPRLRILCGGEGLPRTLANQLLATGAPVWNLYGPTETTIWSTVSRVTAGEADPDIGHPIANTQIYILDAAGRLVPPGVPGELCIGGDGVARGYLNRPELTNERFVPDSFASEPGRRIYRTGDLARLRTDGVIQCLGRVDHQVKIRGYRIEPGEIEAILSRHPRIAQVVVVARVDATGAQRLVAYLVPRGEAPASTELRQLLAASLPEYMIPSVFVSLESLPLTPNGKVDRKSLPEPNIAAREQVPLRTETERKVGAIWTEALGVSSVGARDNFFDLGGHSLLASRVLSRVQDTFGLRLPMKTVFEAPTIGDFAERIDASMPAAAAESRVEIEL